MATFHSSVPAHAEVDADADAGVDWRALDVRLDSTKTQTRLTTRLRGAREFLAA